MKQITKLFLIGSLSLAFIACEKEPVITLNGTAAIEAQAEGGKASISFSANRDWKAVSSASWIHLTPSSGAKTDGSVSITLVCDANPDYDERSATVTLSIEGMSQSVTVRQFAKGGLVVPAQSFELPHDAQSLEVEVQANVAYEVKTSAEWIRPAGTKALSSRLLLFAVDENPDYAPRTATITISAKDASIPVQTVSVKQKRRPYDGDLSPGVFGIHGIAWSYRSGTDQLIYRNAGDKNHCILIDPSANKVFSITIPAKAAYEEGMTLDATLTQNMDKSVPAVVKLKLTVSQQADRYIVLSDAEGHTATLIVG